MQKTVNSSRGAEILLFFLFYAFTFTLPLSIPVAEGFYFALFPLAIIGLIKWRQFQCLKGDRLWWVVGLYVFIILLSSVVSLHHGQYLRKLHRILFFGLIFLIPVYFTTKERNAERQRSVQSLVSLFILGVSVRAVFDLMRVGWELAHGINIIDTASMTVPQFYLVSLCFVLIGRGIWPIIPSWGLVAAGILQMVGMVLHFKRGVWCAFLGCLFLFVLTSKGRLRRVIVMGMCALALLTLPLLGIPQVKERIRQSLDELQCKGEGKRGDLWFSIAPRLIRENPWGVGWNSLRHEDLERHAEYVQPNHNHLHNNVLQVAVELSLPGLLVWCVWMGLAGYYMLIAYLKQRGIAPRTARIPLSILIAFLGLHLNGIVEYNFGDSEVLLLFSVLIGLGQACCQGYPATLKSH